MNFTFDLTVTLSLVFTIFMALVGWVRLRNAAIDKRIDTCGERLDRHEVRIHSAEQTLQSQPGPADLHNLSLSLSEMRGDVREVRTALQGQSQLMARLEAVVSRQEDHLMKGKG